MYEEESPSKTTWFKPNNIDKTFMNKLTLNKGTIPFFLFKQDFPFMCCVHQTTYATLLVTLLVLRREPLGKKDRSYADSTMSEATDSPPKYPFRWQLECGVGGTLISWLHFFFFF